jgi:hypothetical protein
MIVYCCSCGHATKHFKVINDKPICYDCLDEDEE